MTGAQSTVRKAVDFAPDGRFVIAWQSTASAGNDASGSSIQARVFEADGSGLGDEFQINTYTTNDQTQAAVGVGENDEFVVTWTSDGSPETDNTSTSIQARHYTLPQVVNHVPLLSPFLQFVLPAGLLAVGVWTTARRTRAG